ncbi:histone-lysine N-methyltransferase SUVR4-like [Rutidosis leptorrhynchoides]|uniref:histone-lysine N-methyltransferase SUVR4-like n=1 Tax=Rutidosis leptorrhynchoides TaxID=125765 RepID=UPI003A9A659C
MATIQRSMKAADPKEPISNDQKVANAFRAMRGLGLTSEDIRPVLKHLVKLYDGNWELIEEDNYRTLADAIFQSVDDKKNKAAVKLDEQETPPNKSLPVKSDDRASSTRENNNMLSPRRKLIMESNRDPNPSPRKCTDVGPSNMNSAIQKKRRPNQHSDNETEPIPKSPRPVVQSEPTKLFHKIKDITRGTEKIPISLIDKIGIDLPKFTYIHQNTSYQDAYVPFSLARIADDGCCKRCTGDCLSSRVPCACSRETNGEFAYTRDGLLKHEFLDACMLINSNPKSHHIFHCQQVCPLERDKNILNPEPCKGHLLKKFIKECWRKCGCDMECGNRVVQRGITCKLQVFSIESKGWAIRTLEDLPKGSFVCEYIGEILTNNELYERNEQTRKNERHTYPVYLDADWGSEQVLKDEDALCLDATYYGNVARFINHRCHDSSLISIPVEVENPDHHYYHIAFFTKRDVNAYEELTWDYGLDFMDEDHPIKAFECQCGSPFCRDVRRKGWFINLMSILYRFLNLFPIKKDQQFIIFCSRDLLDKLQINITENRLDKPITCWYLILMLYKDKEKKKMNIVAVCIQV